MRFTENGKAHGLYKFRSMDEARDNPGVIAPPPLIALATLVLGFAEPGLTLNRGSLP
jgi:hypothetical protein